MTKQKKNTQRPAQTYPSMKIIMDASPVGIVAFDSDARIVYANPLAAQLFGISTLEALGIKCGDFIDCAKCHMDLQGCGHTKNCPTCPLFNAIGAALSDESNSGIQEGEIYLERDADLTNIWIKYKVGSVTMEGSKFAIMTFEDITGYKKDQEKLRNALAELSVIHEHAPIAMMLVDKDRRIRKINGFAVRFADRPASEMIGLRGGEALRCLHHLDDPEGCGFGPACADCRVRHAVLDTFESKTSRQDIEAWLPLIQGESIVERCLLISTAYLEIDRTERVLVCLQDITDRKRSEEALRESEAKYRVLIKNTNDIIYTLSSSGIFTFVSPGWTVLLGHDVSEVEGKDFRHFVHPDDIGKCEDFLKKVIEFQEPQSDVEYRVKHVDGNYRWHSSNGSPLFDDQQKFISYVGVARDVTDRKRAEDANREAHQRLLTVLNNINAIVYVIDMESYEILFVNQYVRNNFGVVESKKCWNTIHSGQTSPCDFCTNQKLVDAEGNPTGIYRWEFKNKKTRRWYDCHDSAIKWTDGRLVRLEIAMDITDRKRAEEKLKTREFLLNKIFDLLPIGLWFADKNGKILRGNPAGVKIWGGEPSVTMEEYGVFKARRLPSGQEIAPEDWALAHVIKKRITVKDELLEIDAFDGMKKIILNYSAPVLDNDGRLLGAIVMNNDITELKRAEQEHKTLQSQFIQAQKMESVGRLAGGVAHDYNNMLLVISGYAQLGMEQISPDNPLYVYFEEILIAAGRSTEITRQLLAFARKQTINPIVLDLNETVESMLKMLRRLIGEDIDLSWLPESKLWPVLIDPVQIDQILANLCVNARDAIAGVGKITIETENITFDEDYCADHAGFLPGNYILLAISDNGCGMDKEILNYIFEPFFTTKDNGKGTGLGLATVYGIVKQNNGFINVYSEPGNGTTFKIFLPKHAGQVDEIMAGDIEQIPEGRGERVLLVEDEPAIMKMSKIMLENLGYRVLAANTPGEAINYTSQHSGKIHLLITDVIMPEMNGRDLADQLHTLYPDIRVLFMSGYTADVIARQGVLDKNVHFIQKPFSKKDIAVKIRKVLEQV